MTANNRQRIPFALCLLCLAASPSLLAKTIYQYVDQQGAMAFSDSPPEFTNDYVEVELPDAPDPSPDQAEQVQQSLEDMVKVTEKLEAKRREAEAARRQEQETRAQRRESAGEPARQRDEGYGYYYPGYLPPGYGVPHPPRNPGYVNTTPDDPAIQRRQELRVPLRIPGFNNGERFRDRIDPYPEFNHR